MWACGKKGWQHREGGVWPQMAQAWEHHSGARGRNHRLRKNRNTPAPESPGGALANHGVTWNGSAASEELHRRKHVWAGRHVGVLCRGARGHDGRGGHDGSIVRVAFGLRWRRPGNTIPAPGVAIIGSAKTETHLPLNRWRRSREYVWAGRHVDMRTCGWCGDEPSVICDAGPGMGVARNHPASNSCGPSHSNQADGFAAGSPQQTIRRHSYPEHRRGCSGLCRHAGVQACGHAYSRTRGRVGMWAGWNMARGDFPVSSCGEAGDSAQPFRRMFHRRAVRRRA